MPRPGLVLSGFVVADDPSYGPEPMLRAEKVNAYLRLSSLWRGKLEIGTLALENPSLNLVRRDDGHWNLEELVGRTSQVRPAPTATTRPEYRTRFPYVEASAGRINFKLGQVKKSFAFSDADFALWLESDNEWGVRLDARPVRADVPVGDTGNLQDGRSLSASIQFARNTGKPQSYVCERAAWPAYGPDLRKGPWLAGRSDIKRNVGWYTFFPGRNSRWQCG